MTRAADGFRSEALRAALMEAVAGKTERLEHLLSTAGGVRGARPNLGLALAFGAEVANLPGQLAPLLTRLGSDDAPADSARVYLPIVAAHGWAARLRAGREVEAAWAALAELAGDYRGPVRVGTLDALIALGTRQGGADELLQRALGWLEDVDREARLSSAGLVLEALSDRHVLDGIGSDSGAAALLDYLERVITDIADAPRAAERWESRRRALRSLAPAVAAAVAALQGGERGLQWLQAQCLEARHPDLREALSQAIGLLRSSAHTQSQRVVEAARKALEASQKPLRDPTLKRPGTGRGKRSRATR